MAEEKWDGHIPPEACEQSSNEPGDPPAKEARLNQHDNTNRRNQAVNVRVRHVSVKVDPAGGSVFTSLDAFKTSVLRLNDKPAIKDILNDVSADIPSRSLTAIIGASGSGKTTLLNVIAQRVKDKRFRQVGTVSYHSERPAAHLDQDARHTKVGVAYVLQQDVLLPTLTVRETLRYAADLRLSTTKTKKEREAMVESVIAELGLGKCADTRIGDDAHKGCSGGEKRRTSIGVQLLADQPILILDEPTTGLDAASAIQVVQTLKSLADRGKTVIMTIHQPRSEIWRLVDNLILLARGSPVYSGPVRDCLSYFDQLGYKMPLFFNPFDFVIDLAAVDLRSVELERSSLIRVQQLQETWRAKTAGAATPELDLQPSDAFDGKSVAHSGNRLNELRHEILVHIRRTFVVTCRDRLGLLASIVESLSMGIMSGWIFYQLGNDLAGIRSREGAMYSACALQGYLILLFETYRLTIDIPVYDRERIEGVVRPISFIVSRRFARIPLEDLPVPFFYSLIFYFMAGMRADASQFFTFFAIQLLLHMIAVNLATVCVAISRQFMLASLAANLTFTLQSMACGFFINTRTIAIWLRWIKWTAYVFYAFGALCTNEFGGHFYDCPSPGGPSNPACREYTGDYILASLNLPPNWLWRPIVVLVGFILFFFILSGVILQILTTEVEVAKTHESEAASAADTHEANTRLDAQSRAVTITLENFALAVDRKRVFKPKVTKQIFLPINTTFKPGVLNVIMGPSGSGKSSCLNAMARRLYGSPLVKYHCTGKMLLNGSTATDDVITSICSYVPQDDSALLPCLTVRETLHFAARLRLPAFLNHEQKIQRAESVLMQLGLKDCADTLIGSDMVKGISGGEKRRVSIGIQILTDPQVLLLDEPTSGLDAFTAFSIIEVLQGLADEGRTIIFSIHQPRSDMFKQFGGVLLLAKGGEVIYTGPVSEMLPYFEKMGFKCSSSANPADFALDLVSVETPKSLQGLHADKDLANTATTVTATPDAPEGDQHTHTALGAAPAADQPVHEFSPPAMPSVEQEQTQHRSLNQDQEDQPQTETEKQKQLTLPASLGTYRRQRLPFRHAFPILLQRGLLNLRRQPNLLTGRITQLVGLGIVLTAFCAPLGHNYYSVQTRVGYIQAMSSMFFVGMLSSIALYPGERDLYNHESRRDGTYGLESFFCYYLALEVPAEIVASMLFSLLTVFAVGLPRTAGQYFLMAYATFCVVECGESFGILFLTMFTHTGLAVSVMSVVLSISIHLGGVLSIGIDHFLSAVNHISPVKWQVGALLSYSLRGVQFTCSPEQRVPPVTGPCPVQTGVQVLDLYQLNVDTVAYALALGGVTIGYRLLAYVGLKIQASGWQALRTMMRGSRHK
ncbi:putative ABC transporter ATP-binding protein/permease [Exophiala dermatitidis]